MSWFKIFKTAFRAFFTDKVSQMGAALAYYTIFSIAPLLLIAIAIAGFFFGKSTAQSEIIEAVKNATGQEAAGIIQTMLMSAARPQAGLIATITGIITLSFGALGVFKQLKYAINSVWEVAPRPSPGLWYYLKTYIFSFGLVLVVGVLLLVSLAVSAVLSVAEMYFEKLPWGGAALWSGVNMAVSFLIIVLLFGIIFKTLPDVFVRWRDIWPGAIITSLLFTAGKFGLGWYIAHGSAASSFGAAGSLVVLLIWVYWSTQILLFGAEVTQVFANSKGKGIKPKPYAMKIRRQVPVEPASGSESKAYENIS